MAREMRNSGVRWIGEIPSSWSVKRAKYNFENHKYIPGTQSGLYERLALTLKGVVRRSKDDAEGLQPKDFLTYQLLQKGELVFKLIDLQNVSTSRVGLSPYTGLVSPAYIILRANGEVIPEFAEKYFLMLWHRQIFNALGDDGIRSNLSANDLLNIPICYPPLSEQKVIADFLDAKCGEIDGLLSDLDAEVKTLTEYKKSIIAETVTRGLNPNAPMKFSGIPWAESIPAHWTIQKGKYTFTLLQRPVKEDDGVITCFRDGEVTLRSNRREDGFTMSEKEYGYQGIEPGDLVVHGMDGFAGSIGISDSRGKATPVLNVLDSNHNKRYLMYYLRNMAYGNVFLALSTGIRVRSCDLSWKKLGEIRIVLPPMEEQIEIANYLDSKCAAIDQAITDKTQQIETLKAYKSSLIYEYVTGKKQVL